MITVAKQENGVLFTFQDSNKYLYGSGTILVPFNSLSIIQDESDMITLRKSSSNDIFLSARYDTDLGYGSKEEAVEALKGMLYDEAGISQEEVQDMIDEATSGMPSSQVVEQLRTDLNTVSGDVENKQDKLQFYGEDTEQWEETDGDNPDSTAVFTQKQSDILTYDSGDEGSSQAGVQSRVYTVKFNGVLDTGQSESVVNIFANEAPNETTEYGSSIEVRDNGVGIKSSFIDYDDESSERLASINMNNNDLSISLESTANGDSTAMVINTSGVTINNENVATEPYVDAAISGKADTSAVTQVNNALTAHTADTTVHVSQVEKTAWNSKVDTSAITTAITSGSTDSEIPTAKAVYDATQSGGGGATYSAGTNISIDTANTINCTLPITGNNSSIIMTNASNSIAAENSFSQVLGTGNTVVAYGGYNQDCITVEGINNSCGTKATHVEGGYNQGIYGSYSHVEGAHNKLEISVSPYEEVCSHVEGKYNKVLNYSEHASGQYNNSVSSSSTFGDSGNTLFSVGNGTSNSARHNAFEIRQNGDIYVNDGTNDVRLQDTILALGGLKLVKLTQSEYDNLATKDSSTIYFITNVVS